MSGETTPRRDLITKIFFGSSLTGTQCVSDIKSTLKSTLILYSHSFHSYVSGFTFTLNPKVFEVYEGFVKLFVLLLPL